MLIGTASYHVLELVRTVDSVSDNSQTLLQEFLKLFHGVGKLDGEYTIQSHKEACPYILTNHVMLLLEVGQVRATLYARVTCNSMC